MTRRRTTSSAHAVERFWFRPISAAGFGMMRIAFGLTALCVFLMQWESVGRLYGKNGILPQELVGDLLRPDFRLSLLDSMPQAMVFPLYLVLLAALLLVTIGVWTRPALLASLILMFSFHEYSVYSLDGGDTLLRVIGFLLLISPCDRAMSLANLRKRLKSAKDTGKDQDSSERTMPIWPYRLLLWQMIVLYLSSTAYKLSGTTWPAGSAIAIALHHPHFTRLSPLVADWATILSPIASWFVLLTQAAWALLLVFPACAWLGILPRAIRRLPIKRTLLLAGTIMHLSIALTMDVGMFSFAVLAAYVGLLTDNDFKAIRTALNRWFGAKKIAVLFDGRCGFCKASVLVLRSLDFLRRLEFVNFYDKTKREMTAPGVALATLEQAMHVKMQNGGLYAGFSAFRELAWHLPPAWMLAPLLYLPGVKAIGDAVYAQVATHRRGFRGNR